MRRQLLGYLLGELDEEEIEILKEQIAKNPQLKEELQCIREAIDPLMDDRHSDPPPDGLAQETCEHVASARHVKGRQPRLTGAIPIEQQTDIGPNRWNLVNVAVIAGILIAVGMLLLPLLNQSRFQAQLTTCQNNLAELGQAFGNYARNHQGHIPKITGPGRLAVAGIYAPRLLEAGLITNPRVFVCTSSEMNDVKNQVNIPTYSQLVEMEKNGSDKVDKILPSLGGGYAYNLGYFDAGNYRTVTLRQHGTTTTILLADTPSQEFDGMQSSNHAGQGQNVLYADGHVRYLTNCRNPRCKDHDIYHNEEGAVAAGRHRDDVVLGRSTARPSP